jgi:hypothetical protein
MPPARQIRIAQPLQVERENHRWRGAGGQQAATLFLRTGRTETVQY